MKKEFLDKMKSLLGDDFDNFISSLKCDPVRGIAFNNLKLDKDTFLSCFKEKLEELEYGKDNYVFNSNEKMGNNIFHHMGAIYMQEPSAMFAGCVLPLKDGDLVLDACASPGGKTFQVAKRLNGTIVSNEFDSLRAKVLASNVERLGLKNVMVTNLTCEELAQNYSNCFDAVVVDAPCSGEGMFRKEKQAIDQWSEEYVKTCAERQKEILLEIDKCLKVGGYMVYSTCTYSVEENEEIVSFLVDNGYKIVKIKQSSKAKDGLKIAGYNTELAKRFYPHVVKGEGQFVCLLQKQCGLDEKNELYKGKFEVQPTERKVLYKFLEDNFKPEFLALIENNLVQRAEFIYYCPNKSMLRKNIKAVSLGVLLGSIEKGRFEPCHNIFTAFSEYVLRRVNLTENEAYEYIKGNGFNHDGENGWCAVCYLGGCVGGGKMVNGYLKNHYPKGLRLKHTKN